MELQDTNFRLGNVVPVSPDENWTLRAYYYEWCDRIRFRLELQRLLSVGRHMVKDIGLSYEEALHEADKPFWVK